MKKKIFVLYTGGTIGMVQSNAGLRPDPALAAQALSPFSDDLEFKWHICEPLIDSSAVSLQNWRDWLDIIADRLPHFDGVLVLHGTDTLAYTANLFALALQNLDKPLILTGSQLPCGATGSDAPHNLATAVAAFSLPFAQAAIAFDGKLYPAVGSSKISTETAAGFGNAHFGTLAEWDEAQGWHHIRTVAPPHKRLSDDPNVRRPDPAAKVACRTLIPGFTAAALSDDLARTDAQALILQSYGHGNAPSNDAFIRAVRAFVEQGRLVLNISQVPQGRAAAVYAQGDALRRAGAVNGGKCNLETATALMTLAVSQGWGAEDVARELARLDLL